MSPQPVHDAVDVGTARISYSTWAVLHDDVSACRIDQRKLPLDNRYTYSGSSSAAGAGVFIYILDSGVRWNHTFFEGRGRAGTFWPYVGVSNELDNNGHGSHVVSVNVGGRR
jgi:subtilisin family serine protease